MPAAQDRAPGNPVEQLQPISSLEMSFSMYQCRIHCFSLQPSLLSSAILWNQSGPAFLSCLQHTFSKLQKGLFLPKQQFQNQNYLSRSPSFPGQVCGAASAIADGAVGAALTISSSSSPQLWLKSSPHVLLTPVQPSLLTHRAPVQLASGCILHTLFWD